MWSAALDITDDKKAGRSFGWPIRRAFRDGTTGKSASIAHTRQNIANSQIVRLSQIKQGLMAERYEKNRFLGGYLPIKVYSLSLVWFSWIHRARTWPWVGNIVLALLEGAEARKTKINGP